MKIHWSQLHNLPVQTESGDKLGVVDGVEVDVDAHTISHYQVKPGKILVGFFAKPLLIAPEQVVSISADKMTVKDSVSQAEVRTNSEKTRLTLAESGPEVKISEDVK